MDNGELLLAFPTLPPPHPRPLFSPGFSPGDEQIQVQEVLTTKSRTTAKSRIIYPCVLPFFVLTTILPASLSEGD